MGIINNIQRLFTEKNGFKRAFFHVFSNLYSERKFLERVYPLHMDEALDLNHPLSFNQKLQWLKVYDHNPIYTRMVDKVEAKKYVAEQLGTDEYIIPTIAVFDSPEEIDFTSLPNQFVLKVTHDSGGLVICKDKKKLDYSLVKAKLRRVLKTDYYTTSKEWPYKNVRHRIIAEQFLSELESSGDVVDYKVHNFNGIPKFVLVCQNRYSETGLTEDFYDTEWNHLDIKRPNHPNAKKLLDKPKELEKMLELAKSLSKDFSFLRTDFYIINHKIYFGELTLFPASGFSSFVPRKWDMIFGDWIKLPIDKL